MNNQRSVFGASAALLFLLLLIALAFLTHWMGRQWAFVVALLLLTGEFVALGLCISKTFAGIIIDSRNCMSLSKFQACAWTIVVFSALLVAGAFNLSLGRPDALNIAIPNDLLVAMGISAASLAGAPAVLSLKTNQTPTPAALATANSQLAAAAPASAPIASPPPNIGSLMTNTHIDDASWTDMVTGDEVGNFASPDLSKVQQLLVTLLLLGVYGALVFQQFAGAAPSTGLPTLDQGFIWLMGVSHASYLAYKAAPHTSTT